MKSDNRYQSVSDHSEQGRERSEYYIFELSEAKASLKGILAERRFTRWKEETGRREDLALASE